MNIAKSILYAKVLASIKTPTYNITILYLFYSLNN